VHEVCDVVQMQSKEVFLMFLEATPRMQMQGSG
jgi:hypothetical protein